MAGPPRELASACVLLLGLGLAAPAQAITCRSWTRMSPDQQYAAVDRMIAGAIGGSGAHTRHVDRGAVGRCLQDRTRQIVYDFDGACADRRTSDMQSLNRIFKHYIWTCAG